MATNAPYLIGGATGQDPILFLIQLLDGYIYDENANHVSLVTAYPKRINQIPRVVLKAKEETMEFLSIPAVRRRWTAPFDLLVWAISVEQRYAIKQSIQARLDYLANPTAQWADNYVYMWYSQHTYEDEVLMFGQPIFRVFGEITLKYDVLVSQAQI